MSGFSYFIPMTFPDVSVNYWAILACVASNMILGALWYGPILGKRWMRAMGMDPDMVIGPEKKKQGNKATMLMIPLAFLTAWVLAYMVDYTVAIGWMEGAQTGFWLWLGFQLPLILQGKIFENKKMDLIYINGVYQLVALMLQGAILAAWI